MKNQFAEMEKINMSNRKFNIRDDRKKSKYLQRVPFVEKDSVFYQFLKTSYFDLEVFFQSMSAENKSSYFYFGDMQKDLFFISDNMREDFGFHSNVVPGFLEAWEHRIASEKAKEIYRKSHEILIKEKQSVHSLRYRVRDISGKSMWIQCYGLLKWNEDRSKPLFFSGRITHQDNDFEVDPVTSFPRTSVMLRKFTDIIFKKKAVRTIGFCFNNIREINSTKGRAYSDYMIRMCSEELISSLASKVIFYRLNGTKCIALVKASCSDSVDSLVEEIRKIIFKWYARMGISVHQACSFAVMRYDRSPVRPEEFLEQMVTLIKLAKSNGDSVYEEYSGENIQKLKQLSEITLSLNHDVMNGMKNFRIVIQPMVRKEDKRIIGGEALLRWQFAGKDVPPCVFIPMLEKMNVIHLVGRWVFEQAVCACMRLRSYQEQFYLSFNVSMQQLADQEFADYMKNILLKYKADGTYMVAEMTENFMDKEPEKMFAFAGKCQEMNIRIALDDFGNGYSSIRRLLQYPSSVIKLDRSLLEEMMESEEKKNFISSIVYACHSFGKKVCMEGVETSEQNCMIEETGCDMIQGFYYHRPIEVREVYKLLSVSNS